MRPIVPPPKFPDNPKPNPGTGAADSWLHDLAEATMRTSPKTASLSEQLKRMTNAEIRAFWVELQLAKKKAGLPFCDVLMGFDDKIAVDLRDGR